MGALLSGTGRGRRGALPTENIGNLMIGKM